MLRSIFGLSKMPEPKKVDTDNSSNDGVFLGIDNLSQKPIILSTQEINQHVFLCGTTGSGKTTTIFCFADFAMRTNLPLVIVDGKGDWDFVQSIKDMADKYNRSFQLFSISEPDKSYHYNPLASGGPTELKDRLIELSEWKEPYYQYMAERYLQLALTLFEKAHESFDLYSFVMGMTPGKLQMLARQLDAPDSVMDYLENVDKKGISGLIDRLNLIIESQIGYLFFDESEKTIELNKAVEVGNVVLFSLDSLAYPLYAKLVGRLVINDLKAVASKRTKKDTLIMTIYDEFNVFASRNVVDLINKSRSKGFAALISTQSLADLDVVDNALKSQIIQNCNTLIVQRQNDAKDAEELSKIIGTEDSFSLTQQIGSNNSTGLGSVRFVKEFIIHPDKIKRLEVGQAVIVRKIPKFETHETTIKRIK
ncbi:type IV secretory system conjugative DNA transfer family protein [Sporomusa aerivorans]|uniref:type IV secretory system conjugative DNA transfer family protein n=1 Tax=Sporomusa aerivorans TaxID=204936 RepID=UPI00352A1155